MSEMDIIILADAQIKELDSLTAQNCHAMLPVAGKPVLEHVLESVASVDHNRVYIVISAATELIELFIGAGERWGLNAETWVSRGNTSAHDIVRRKSPNLSAECFVIDCLNLADIDLKQVIEKLSNTANDVSQARIDSEAIGCTWFGQACSTKINDCKMIDFAAGDFIPVKSMLDYYQANRKLTGPEKPRYLTTRGKLRAIGLTAESGTRIHPSCIKVGSVFAGTNTIAHRSSEFHGNVVLGSEVVIGKGCIIKDAVILDKSYVGDNLTVESAIVSGNVLVPMDTLLPVELDDPFLLSEFNEQATKDFVLTLFDQITAAIVLILTLPIWILALALSYTKNSGSPIVRKQLVGNQFINGHRSHAPFRTFEFNCRSGLLKHMPLLSAVAQGKLRWFGVMPLAPDTLSEREESWQLARDQYPVGLLGPAQNQYGLTSCYASVPGKDHNSYLLADALFAQYKSTDILKEAISQNLKRIYGSRSANQA